MLTGRAFISFALPVDSIMSPAGPGLPDLTNAENLDEIVVEVQRSRKIISTSQDGAIELDIRHNSEMPSFMGGGDAISTIRSLPAVATQNDLQATLSVRGSSPGGTLFEADGSRIINPLHLLGMYSAFNPAFFKTYKFRESRIPAVEASSGGSSLSTFSGLRPDTCLTGSLSAGVIESNAAISIPLKKNLSSVSVGLRQSYLNLLFPNIIRLGESVVRYNFTDVNASFTSRAGNENYLKASLFYSRDAMGLHSDKNGTKDGRFDWSNINGALNWWHKNLWVNLSYTRLYNHFAITEATHLIDLPSDFTQISGKALLSLKDLLYRDIYCGNLSVGIDLSYRNSSLQHNIATINSNYPEIPNTAVEGNVAADWDKQWNKFRINIGVRLALYQTGNYTNFSPMPRLSIAYSLTPAVSLYIAYGRYIRFDRQIMESNAGLPTDFWINAYKGIKPEDVNSLEIGVNGNIISWGLTYNLAIYGKLIRNVGEFTGTILNFVNSTYEPLNDYITGRGRVTGLTASLERQIGKIRFRASYAYTVSRGYFARYDNKSVPTSTDRPHDLNVNISYSPIPSLIFSMKYIYATGTPYTRAKYGYMIGENLIAEYFPHNSSRLPDYKRLDFSATWQFLRHKHQTHSLNLSVYNMLANKNVLFTYTEFNSEGRIATKNSVMKAVIPSLTYSYVF